MSKIKIAQQILMNLDVEIKENKQKIQELENLKKYISKSNMFNGKKKKIYALINKQKKKYL